MAAGFGGANTPRGSPLTIPSISVVVTAYNRGALLPRALDSLRAQTCADWEAVVVDDGSTDDTPSYLAEEAAREPRLRVVTQANGGLAAARNAGLAAATAPLLTFLDSDDEYRPRHLETRLAFLKAHPGVDLIHGGFEVVGGADWVPDRHDPTRRIPLAECYVGGTFVMRRAVYERLGGYRRPDYGDDYEFIMRARELFKVARVDEPTYVYHRETPDGMCNVMAARHGADV